LPRGHGGSPAQARRLDRNGWGSGDSHLRAGMNDAAPRTPPEIVRPLLRVRQTRQFTEEAPTDAELAAIADVARWSGSGTNRQPWRFIVVRDVQALRQIHDAGLPQTRSLATARAAIAIALPGDDGD